MPTPIKTVAVVPSDPFASLVRDLLIAIVAGYVVARMTRNR